MELDKAADGILISTSMLLFPGPGLQLSAADQILVRPASPLLLVLPPRPKKTVGCAHVALIEAFSTPP